MIKKEIVMLVIASRGTLYDQLINKYWSKFINYVKTHEHPIKIYMIFGKTETDDLQIDNEDKLVYNDICETLKPGLLKKTIRALEYIESSYDYKHVLRTNLSSFFILEKLLQISNNMENTDIYAGVLGRNNILISGAGIWLSSDNVRFLINNKHNLAFGKIDDVSISLLLVNKRKIPKQRYDLVNGRDIDDKEKLLLEIQKNHYHIRIKSRNPELDIKYMTTFTDILYS